uniref:Uncharacterized protein n=1 Tax=Glycine max TaxID=3847 RepID=A0A0R0GF78_SOYBN
MTNLNLETFRHYLVVPVVHIPTVKYLQRKTDDYYLVSHMLKVGKMLLNRDAPQSQQYILLTHDVGFNCICCP